jgi:hypothetical protein
MIYRIWRLSEAGPDNLGLACTNDGLLLGRTPLIERRDERFIVRERPDIERLLQRAYQDAGTAERLMPGLAIVARALNADDPCLARIAAVHLKIPDLPNAAARQRMEQEDILIKYARDEADSSDWNPALHPRIGTPPNPGWFAPTGGPDSESSPVRIATNDRPTQRSDSSQDVGDDWVRLRTSPKRIDELADFVEWMANARPEDEQAIRAEIKRYFYDVGDQGSAAALNSALTVLLRPGLAREDRQQILNSLDVFTRVDPAEYARNRDWATGAGISLAGLPPVGAGEAAGARSAATEIAPAETASEVWMLGWAKYGCSVGLKEENISAKNLAQICRTHSRWSING